MIHLPHHHRWIATALIGAMAFCVTVTTLAQAPSRDQKVYRFSQPGISDSRKGEVIPASAEMPRRTPDVQNEVSSNAPQRAVRPVVIRFGQSSRHTEWPTERELGSDAGQPRLPRPVEARPVAPRRKVGDDSMLAPPNATTPSEVDFEPLRASPREIVNPRDSARRHAANSEALNSTEVDSKNLPAPFQWVESLPLPETDMAETDVVSAVPPRVLLQDSKPFPRTAANGPALLSSRTGTAPARHMSAIAPRPVREAAVTRSAPVEDAEAVASLMDDEESPTDTESARDDNPPLVFRGRGRARETELSANVDSPAKPIQNRTAADSETAASAVTISFAPNALIRLDLLMVVFVGGGVLLMGGFCGAVLLSLTRNSHPPAATVKFDITNNGFAPKMLGDASAESPAVTMTVSQPTDQTKAAHRVPTNLQPQTPNHSQPVPDGDSRPVMTEDWQPAPRVSQTAVASSFSPTTAAAKPQFAPQPAIWTPPTPAAPTDRKDEFKRQQADREAAVARQMLDQNLDLRAKLSALKDKAA